MVYRRRTRTEAGGIAVAIERMRVWGGGGKKLVAPNVSCGCHKVSDVPAHKKNTCVKLQTIPMPPEAEERVYGDISMAPMLEYIAQRKRRNSARRKNASKRASKRARKASRAQKKRKSGRR